MRSHLQKKQHPAAVKIPICSTNVDDLLENQPTLKDMLKVAQGAINILGFIGMKLVKFKSNCTEFFRALPTNNTNLELMNIRQD